MIYINLCQVKEVIAGKRISYSWRYQGYQGHSLLTFDLEHMGAQTKVTLTHAGLETFPADNPAFARNNFEGGWGYFMNEGLPKYLNSLPV